MAKNGKGALPESAISICRVIGSFSRDIAGMHICELEYTIFKRKLHLEVSVLLKYMKYLGRRVCAHGLKQSDQGLQCWCKFDCKF